MNSKKSSKIVNRPLLPGRDAEQENKTVKLDKSSIESLIQGLSGAISKSTKKDDKKDDISLKELKDSIIDKFDKVSDTTRAIQDVIIGGFEAINANITQNRQDNSAQVVAPVVSPVNSTNAQLNQIIEGIYYIVDALYGQKKWTPKYKETSINTNKITGYDKKNSILGVITGKDTAKPDVVKYSIDGLDTENDGLKSAVNIFLAIVNQLDECLKKGSLKNVAKNFRPEEFTGVLKSLQALSEEIVKLNIPMVEGGKNPLASIGEIFNSINAIKNYDIDEIMDSMDELTLFLVGSDFKKQLKRVINSLNEIHQIFANDTIKPEIIYKDFKVFSSTLNELFGAFDSISLKSLIKLYAKTLLLTNPVTGLNAIFKPIFEEVSKVHSSLNENPEVLAFKGDLELFRESVINPFNEFNESNNIKGSIKALAGNTLLLISLHSFNQVLKTAQKSIVLLESKEFDKLDDVKDKLEQLAGVSKSLKTVMSVGTSMVITAPLAFIGFWLATKAIKRLTGIVDALNSKNLDKDALKNATANVKELGEVILFVGGVMLFGALIGGVVLSRFKELIAFGAVFAAFSICIIGSLNIATRGFKNSLNNVKEIGLLIATLAGVMLFGALTGGIVLKRLPQILGFGVALGAFIFLVVSALSLATKFGGGLRHLEKSAKAIVGIVSISAMIMLVGGAIFLTQPKLILASLSFAMVLGAFLFSLTKAISVGAQAVRKNLMGLTLIMAFEIVTASVLLFPAMMMVKQPWLVPALVAWEALTLGYVWGMTKLADRITKSSKDFAAGMAGLALLGLFNLEMAGSMWVLVKAAKEFAVSPDGTAWAGAGLIIAAGAMLAGEIGLLWLMEKLDQKKLAKSTLTIAALGAIMAEVAGSMYLWTEVAKNVEDKDALLETIALGTAMIAGETLLVQALSKISPKNLATGVIALAGLTMISASIAKMMDIWSVSAMNFDGKQEAFKNVMGTAALLMTGIGVIAGILGEIAFAGGGIGAAVLAAGGAVMEGIILLSMQMATMMNMWIGVAESAKRLNGIDTGEITGVFEVMGTSAKTLITTFAEISILDLIACCGAASTLGITISTIAEGVAQAANMHYTKYENGKKVGEFNLSQEDFARAAENTKQVVSVLGRAIIDIYEENPEIFGGSTDIAGLLGLQTKFGKVCKSTMLLGQVISQIADGVVHMSNLSYTKYINGKSVGTFNLTAENFTQAANNTKKVIKTLGQAIIDVYEENPEMFQFKSGTLYGALGLDALLEAFGAENPFAKTCNTVALLGNLISTIADSVIKMANGDVKYYENGQEKHRTITPEDYKAASDNTNMIIKTLGQAVIDAYNNNPELFSSGSSVGDALGFSPKFKGIIETVGALGTMIKNIADGIQTFANGAVPVYGKNGEVVDKRPIGLSDYQKASDCIQSIITTLGNSIMRTYELHKDWFTDDSFWGNDPEDTPFGMTIRTLSGMSKLVGDYAKQVQDFAKGNIPIYGLNGEILTYVPMTKETYTQAGDAIGSVISTMANALDQTYKDHEDLFDEDNWEPLETALTSLNSLVGKYTSTIKDFANLTITLYDENGKESGKKNLGADEITAAGTNITSIITTLVNAVRAAYTGPNGENKELFNTINSNSNTTWFSVIVNSTQKSAQLISKLASAVKDYANMRVDSYDENGRKIGTRAFTDADFKNAGKHIGQILTGIADAINTTYKEHSDLFNKAVTFSFSGNPNNNAFSIVAQAGAKAGQMIAYCAKGFNDVANIKNLNNRKYVNNVKKNIKTLLGAMAFAVQDTYKDVSKAKDNIFINASNQNSIISRIYTALTQVSKLTSEVVKVYDSLSKMDVEALKKVTGVATDHSDNLIYQMIKGLAQPIVEIFNDTSTTNQSGVSYNTLFNGSIEDSYFGKIKLGVNQVANMMKTVQSVYDSVSKMEITIDGKGSPSEKISQMIKGLAQPIIDVASTDKSGVFGNTKLDKVLDGLFNVAMNLTPAGLVSNLVNGLSGKEKAPDTPFGRVVNGLATELKIIGAIVSVYQTINGLDISKIVKVDRQANKKVDIIGTLVNGLIDPIIDLAQGTGKDGKGDSKIEQFNSAYKDIQWSLTQITNMFLNEKSGILSIYKQLADIHFPTGVFGADGGLLARMMRGVINSINMSNWKEGETEKIKNSLEDCFDEFDEIFNDPNEGLFSIYKNLAGLVTSANLDFSDKGDSLSSTLTNLMKGVNNIFATDNVKAILELNTLDFYNRINNISSAMDNVYKMYENIPQLNKDLEYFIPYLRNLQQEVGVVPNIKEFEQETNTLTKFNNSVNSLRIQNVRALQNLMIELNKFGTKFGNLDKFTEVLATKLSNCLTYLADQIRDSAKIVNKTGELNEARKKQIQETINQFQELANQGINVFVQQGSSESGVSAVDGGKASTYVDNNSTNNDTSSESSIGTSSTKAKQSQTQNNTRSH